jgi:hypothetical protein
VYFYTPQTIDRIINKIGMQVVDRVDLPGHRITSSRLSGRVVSWIEFFITNYKKDILWNDKPYTFVLVAKPKLNVTAIKISDKEKIV